MAPRAGNVVPLLFLAGAFASIGLATLLEGKRLWAAYNAIGAVATLLFALAVRRHRIDLPRWPTLVCFLTLCLHYVGGSLGGHFGIRGVNGLYAVFPWYDRVTHFGGAVGVSLLLWHLLAGIARRHAWGLPPAALSWFAFALTMSVGVGVELFEFAAWFLFGTIDQGFYSNTMMDLFVDACGAAFGAGLALALASKDADAAQAPRRGRDAREKKKDE